MKVPDYKSCKDCGKNFFLHKKTDKYCGLCLFQRLEDEKEADLRQIRNERIKAREL